MEAGQYCTFVIHRDGAVSACGKGSYGRLGLGTSSSQPVPCRLTFDQCRTFRRVSSSKGSDGHTLALTVDGQVYSWGDGKPKLFDDGITAGLENVKYPVVVELEIGRGKSENWWRFRETYWSWKTELQYLYQADDLIAITLLLQMVKSGFTLRKVVFMYS